MRKYLYLLLILPAFCQEGNSQSQTRTANRFNWNGNPYMNLWDKEGALYVSGDDNSFAYSKKLSANRGFLSLVLQDFKFDLPENATIGGITVSVRRFKKGKASITDYFAWLYRTGSGFYNPSPYGVRWTDPTNYPDAEGVVNYYQTGSGNNGVGLGNEVYTWTPAMINNADFGVRIDTYAPVGGSVVVYYDQVTITVDYSVPAASLAKPPVAEAKQLVKAPVVFPNPFTTNASIQFTAAENGNAVVELYSITGAKVRSLFSSTVTEGQVYQVNAGDALLPKGTYVFTVQNGKSKHTGQIVKME